MTALFEIINGNRKPDAGTYEWGQTITHAYLPLDNPISSIPISTLWTGSHSSATTPARYISSDSSARCCFRAKTCLKSVGAVRWRENALYDSPWMMMRDANTLVLDSPTNHLDLESIQPSTTPLQSFKGNVLMASHDHEFIQTICNRIIELTPGGIIDKLTEYDDYITDPRVAEARERLYGNKMTA